MSDAHTSDSSEGKISTGSNIVPTEDSKTKEASRFTPKSINKRLIVLCDGL